MAKFRASIKSMCLVALLLACTIASVSARAKAWDDDDDGWFDSEEGNSAEEEPPKSGNILSAPSSVSSNSNSKPNLVERQNEGGLQSGNFAAHNESCGPNRKQCILGQNLICTTTDGTGRCICAPEYVYVKETETCWLIPKSGEDACHHDVQCRAGKWGQLSRCDKHTKRCQCYDIRNSGKLPVVLVDGVCYIEKTPGDLCHSHEECDKPIKGGAYCQGGEYTGDGGHANYTGACQCRDSHTWFSTLKECLKKAEQLNDPCVVTEQCRRGNLGQHSVCNIERGRCECHGKEGEEVIYYKTLKKCFLKKVYNETCEEDDECRASLGPDVKCGKPSDEYQENVCYCPLGTNCRSSGYLATSNPYTLGATCMAAVVIGITVTNHGLGGGMEITSSGW